MSLTSNHADASQGFAARAFFVDSTRSYCGELSPCSTRLRLLGFVREYNNASEASKLQHVSSKKGLQRYMDAFTPHYITDLPIGR